ncbi:AraC family transcriptional regulator [Streptomyces sp. 8K308]|uniref:AraC family transcriptional regulator n=1 Tax=Streptomyces sp. 8K308 TaxID=2530388 RepID=UPI0026BBFB3B
MAVRRNARRVTRSRAPACALRDLTGAGTPHGIRPGRVSLIPPATTCRYHYRGCSEHLYAHLCLPTTGEPHTVPVMQDTGPELPTLSTLMRQAVAAWPSTPSRAAAEIWTALWRVASLAPPEQGRPNAPHSAVNTAIAHIEAHLADPLTTPDIARAAGISHNHLTRLFRATTGGTVIAYIRQRRLARPHHLMRASTRNPRPPGVQQGLPPGPGRLPRALRAAHRTPDAPPAR